MVSSKYDKKLHPTVTTKAIIPVLHKDNTSWHPKVDRENSQGHSRGIVPMCSSRLFPSFSSDRFTVFALFCFALFFVVVVEVFNPLVLSWCVGGKNGPEIVGVTNQWMVQLDNHAMRSNLLPTLPGGPEIRCQVAQRSGIESNTTSQENSVKWCLEMFNYTQILVPNPLSLERLYPANDRNRHKYPHSQTLGKPWRVMLMTGRKDCRSQGSQEYHKRAHRIHNLDLKGLT